tara:strand:- start:303 stop:686 length:384 start_codon:yes stop_codon:yes gene_type:complete
MAERKEQIQMKKFLTIIVLSFFSSGEAHSKEKMIVCYNNDIELRFYIDEENSRVRSGGDLIENFYMPLSKKDSDTYSWVHKYKQNGKKFITFSYYNFKENVFRQNAFPDKINLTKEDLIGRVQLPCR